MSHFDLHEQEQISNLRYFWNRGGKYLALLIVIAFFAYFIYVWLNWRSSSESSNASQVYATFIEKANSSDKDKSLLIANQLQNEYPKTEYASMASILAAKITWDKKDIPSTIKYLNWTIDNSKDPGLVSTSQLRLADVYIDEKKFDKAIQLMFQKHDPAFDPLFYSKRGDLYVAKGDLTKARDAYKEALQKAGQDSSMAQGIQMRLDILGVN